MAVQDTAIFREVSKIMGSNEKPVNFYWECQIHANNKTHRVIRIAEIEFNRNYLRNYGDEVYVDVYMMPGDFNYDVAPYKDNIEITLIKRPIGETTSYIEQDKDIFTQRYSAVAITSTGEVTEGNRVDRQSKEMANRGDIMLVKFQIIDKAINKLRMISTGGTFRNVKAMDVARTLLGISSKSIDLEEELMPKGVDIALNHTEEIKEHVIIPPQSPLCLIPRYIHNRYGLYSTGFGNYYQNGLWYFYPTYDIERYNNCSKTLTVINVPKDRMPGLERTYRETPNQIILIATGDTKQVDQSEEEILNTGNALRFANASNIISGFSKTEDNRTTMSSTENISEVVSESRKDNLNFIRQSNVGITNNVSLQKSIIARQKGAFVHVIWENAAENILYPGMPTKYIYQVGSKAFEVTAVLTQARYFVTLDGSNMLTNRHRTQAALQLFVSKQVMVELQ